MTLFIKGKTLLKTLFIVVLLSLAFSPSSAFASISTGNSSNLDQLNYRWRFDDGSESAATWREATNTGITDISTSETSLRIRLNIDVPTNRVNVSVQPRLEFSSDATGCTDGSWTIIGAQGSASIWRLKASTHFADGANTTQQISADTFTTGDIYESTQTGTAISISGNTNSTEIEWSIEANGPAEGTTYRFRATNAGTAFGSYSQCATLATASAATPTFTLNDYRWYVDNDSENVSDPWGVLDIAENTAITPVPVGNDPPSSSQELRLRVNFTVNTANLSASSQQFKLQFKAGTDGSCTSGSWTDIGAVASSAWQFASSGVTDGTTLTVLKLAASDVLEVYAKANPTATNPNSATTGQDIEYDFHIIGSGSDFANATQYSFRVLESDDTVFDGYTTCPTLTTEPGTGNLLRHGNFFSSGSEQGFFWAD